jgi:flagellar hook-basal body complex protein FliE
MIERTYFQPLQLTAPVQKMEKKQLGAVEMSEKFGGFLNRALEQVNQQQMESKQLSEKFIVGELTDVHQMLIAGEKASLGLEMTLQVRNKIIEAYQEIMRMQI